VLGELELAQLARAIRVAVVRAEPDEHPPRAQPPPQVVQQLGPVGEDVAVIGVRKKRLGQVEARIEVAPGGQLAQLGVAIAVAGQHRRRRRDGQLGLADLSKRPRRKLARLGAGQVRRAGIARLAVGRGPYISIPAVPITG